MEKQYHLFLCLKDDLLKELELSQNVIKYIPTLTHQPCILYTLFKLSLQENTHVCVCCDNKYKCSQKFTSSILLKFHSGMKFKLQLFLFVKLFQQHFSYIMIMRYV